jgi:type II restriction enzyme
LKGQSHRLANQHKESKGVEGIFGDNAKLHDTSVGAISQKTLIKLKEDYPHLSFRYRSKISKSEINKALSKKDKLLGQTLFVSNSSIRPDGGLIEVLDKGNNWRIILITEAKHQGKDIENIRAGKLVGKNNDQDLMAAGNAIERSHKNIAEMANLMIAESHFPYVLFLEGSNFLTKTISIERPDGRLVVLDHNSGTLNRLDRLTSANYGMPINTNLCVNKIIQSNGHSIMLKATSIFTQGDGDKWNPDEMMAIMLDVAKTSLGVLQEQL